LFTSEASRSSEAPCPQAGDGGHGLDGLQREAARKDRERVEECALRLAEQLVAPIERSSQALLARQSGPAAACEAGKAILQAGGNGLDRQDPDAGGGQLDRQGDAIQPGADLRHG
jgi:hypothetical protein